jgi:hypothetical protein
MECINAFISAWGWGNAFGHSFHIGGASFYLAQKVPLVIVQIAGCWKSLAYETYIQGFEQTAFRYMGNVTQSHTSTANI